MASKAPIPPPCSDDLAPDWHIRIVEERLAEYGPDFKEGKTWEEFEKELFEQLMKD